MLLYIGDTDSTLYVTPYLALDSGDTFFLVTVGWLYWEFGILFGEI
jgi:hypothetical protein